MTEKHCSAFVVGLLDQIADEFTNAEMCQEDLSHTIYMLRDKNKKLEAQVWELEKELDNLDFEKESESGNSALQEES